MAGKTTTDYSALVKKLRAEGPGRLYLLWGEETYLRDSFFEEIKKCCLDGSADDFNYRRLEMPTPDLQALTEAVNAVPFFAERTLVELRGLDLNKCREEEARALGELFADIPDYCTLVLIPDIGFSPDGRLSIIKNLRKAGEALEFTPQGASLLVSWIVKRFSSFGKQIDRREAEHLIFVSGSLMNTLILEIEKIAAYAKGERISGEDIDAVAQKQLETNVFEMTDKLSARDFDGAAAILADLLAGKQAPIMLLAVIGQQMRRLYAAKLAAETGQGRDYIAQVCGIKYDFITNRLISGARGFSLEGLRQAVCLCAEYDYKMKSSSSDDEELLRELLIRLSLGVRND